MRKRVLTDVREAEVARMYLHGERVSVIADCLSVSDGTIRNTLRSRGISPIRMQGNTPLDSDTEDQIIDLYQSGLVESYYENHPMAGKVIEFKKSIAVGDREE